MAFNELLADRIRDLLSGRADVEEKKMMGGLTFMVDGKMCVGIVKDDLMARIHPELHEDALKKEGCRTMDFTGRPMPGYVFINPDGTNSQTQLQYWIGLALDYNPLAKSSKKKSKKK